MAAISTTSRVARAIRRIFGLDFPAPVVGQLWRSDFSGNTIEVTRAEVLDDGVVFVEAREYRASGRPAMADFFCCGLGGWRHRLRAEHRVLIGVTTHVAAPEPDPALVDVVTKAIARDIAANAGPIWAALREHRLDDPKAGA